MRAGEMYFSFRHVGWIFPADDRAIPRLLREQHQAPFVFTFCPFCSETLPDLASGIEQEPWKDDGPE